MKKGTIFIIAALTVIVIIAAALAARQNMTADHGSDSISSEGDTEMNYTSITMEEAREIFATDGDYIILDVRTQEEYEDRHIPGALCIPNETIGSEDIPELPDKEQLILVYCRSGNRSKQASEKLAALGYTNIVEFGGINDWPGETVSGNG